MLLAILGNPVGSGCCWSAVALFSRFSVPKVSMGKMPWCLDLDVILEEYEDDLISDDFSDTSSDSLEPEQEQGKLQSESEVQSDISGAEPGNDIIIQIINTTLPGEGGAGMGENDAQVQLPDVVSLNQEEEREETHLQILTQVTAPFFVAGIGMVLAGIYFSYIQTWEVFREVKEIVILVPSLLGLKGNLEMTLASRLSTEANMGRMDDKRKRWITISRNLVLVHCQAIVVALLACFVAGCLNLALRQELDFSNFQLLGASALLTASFASLFLGFITSMVITVSRIYNINPDNVATPMAASLGDITSLVLLSWIAHFFYEGRNQNFAWWLAPVVIIGYMASIPIWYNVIKENEYTKMVLYTGWVPVISAMVISTCGGLLLDVLVTSYRTLAVFQPVINGVGGNLVSVLASRLSTGLHRRTTLGTLPPNTPTFINPITFYFRRGSFSVTSRVLISLVIPGHLAFIYAISFILNMELTPAFVCLYLMVSVLQVMVLLYMGYVLTYYFWSRGVDPDNSTIPYLTAAGDVLGIVLLGVCFKFLSTLGEMPYETSES